MRLLFQKNILDDARNMVKGGTIRALAIIDSESGEIVKLTNNEQEAFLYIRNNTPKDECPYISSVVDLKDVINKEVEI